MHRVRENVRKFDFESYLVCNANGTGRIRKPLGSEFEFVDEINTWADQSPVFTHIHRTLDPDVFELDWVPGVTLADELEAGSLSDPDLMRVLLLVGDAITYLHQQHIEHNDLHPGNIIIQHFDLPQAVPWLTEPGRVLVSHLVPTIIDYETMARIGRHDDNYDFCYLFTFLARRIVSDDWMDDMMRVLDTPDRTCPVAVVFDRIKNRAGELGIV